MKKKKIKKFLKPLIAPFAFILILVVFILIFTAILLIIISISLGLLSIIISLGCLIGLLYNVATDLSPLAMLLAGVFCVFLALTILMAVLIFAPKAVNMFHRVFDWFMLEDNDFEKIEN